MLISYVNRTIRITSMVHVAESLHAASFFRSGIADQPTKDDIAQIITSIFFHWCRYPCQCSARPSGEGECSTAPACLKHQRRGKQTSSGSQIINHFNNSNGNNQVGKGMRTILFWGGGGGGGGVRVHIHITFNCFV